MTALVWTEQKLLYFERLNIMKKLKSIISITLAFILCSSYMLNNIAAYSRWTEFEAPSTDMLFFTDGSNSSFGHLYMSVAGDDEGYTDLRAHTHAENIFFHGHTHVPNDIYFIGAKVSVGVMYEDESTHSFTRWDLCEENYTRVSADAVFEYLDATPECYTIEYLSSSHTMYIVTGLEGFPEEPDTYEQYGPSLTIGTSY